MAELLYDPEIGRLFDHMGKGEAVIILARQCNKEKYWFHCIAEHEFPLPTDSRQLICNVYALFAVSSTRRGLLVAPATLLYKFRIHTFAPGINMGASVPRCI